MIGWRHRRVFWQNSVPSVSVAVMATYTLMRSSLGLLHGLKCSFKSVGQIPYTGALTQSKVLRNARCYSVSHLSVQERIEKKRKAALTGGGQLRIAAQHKRVSYENLLENECSWHDTSESTTVWEELWNPGRRVNWQRARDWSSCWTRTRLWSMTCLWSIAVLTLAWKQIIIRYETSTSQLKEYTYYIKINISICMTLDIK